VHLSARELISEKGPGAVSINQIAAHAGVGKQTIYRWWPRKASVLIDALEQQFESESPFPTSGSAKDDIRDQMRTVAASFSSQGDSALAEEFRTRFVAERRRGGAAALRAGMADGQVRADLDVAKSAQADVIHQLTTFRRTSAFVLLTAAAMSRPASRSTRRIRSATISAARAETMSSAGTGGRPMRVLVSTEASAKSRMRAPFLSMCSVSDSANTVNCRRCGSLNCEPCTTPPLASIWNGIRWLGGH